MSCVDKTDITPYVSLFSQMGLPVLDGMADIWKADIEHWRNNKALENKTEGENVQNADEDCMRGWAARA